MSQWIKINNVGNFICGDFIPTGTPYNFTISGKPSASVGGVIYTGWNTAPINPSDSNFSIRLSSGSYVEITYSGVSGNYVAQTLDKFGLRWNSSNNTTSLGQPFELFSGLTPVYELNEFRSQVKVSGFLPREHNRLFLRTSTAANIFNPGGQPPPYPIITVSGNFGFLAPTPNCLKITNVGTNICTPNSTNCIKINDVKRTPTWDIGIQTTVPNQSFSINLIDVSRIEIFIDWGDGTSPQFFGSPQGLINKTYSTPGNYIVKIYGELNSQGAIRLGANGTASLVKSTSIIPYINGLKSAAFMFAGTHITSFPEDLFINNPQIYDFLSCFSSSKISNIPLKLFSYNTLATNFSSCFSRCENLTYIPAIFYNNIEALNFAACFIDCLNISSFDPSIFNNNLFVESFEDVFSLGSFPQVDLDPASYSDLLENLANTAALRKNNVPLSVASYYYEYASASKDFLINNKGWTINDLGEISDPF